jgi:hypothetical protein
MKYGIANKALTTNTTLTSTITAEAGKDEENILDEDSLYIWEVEEGAVTLTAEFDSAIDVDLIGIFNVTCQTSVQIIAYSTYPGTVAATKTVTTANLGGLDLKCTFLELDSTTSIDAVEIVTVGATSTFLTSVGYLWVGEVIDFGCLEAMKPNDSSADNVTITRANQPDVKEVYNFQSYDVTVKKDTPFFALRDTKIRTIFDNGGYGQKRPFLFNDGPFDGYEEILLGIFDAPKFSPDVIYFDVSDWQGQITLGIREVF